MGSETQHLHILLFPFMAPGHMNPMVDMGKLFARQGVKATILTTPANTPLNHPTINHANQTNNYPHPITLLTIPFPSTEAGLPDGCENLSSVPSPELESAFLKGVAMLRQPFDHVLREHAPHCVVTDIFLPWTYNVAAEHNIPRLVFHGMCFFALCALDNWERHKSLECLPPDVESFILPGFPHRIEMLRTQIPDLKKLHPAFAELIIESNESESRSYGVVVNSFYELEPDYAKHYREVVGRKAWHIGPVSLCNKDEADMSTRGNEPSIDCDACLKWLDNKTKTPGSVVYVCFGSLSEFTMAQLREIALGLEASNYPFIWVVRDRNLEDWLPERYEERIIGRGLIIKGWAPQLLILNHPAVGGLVTHCGWNSCLEGVSAGVPLVTWPLFAEQFYNERLIVDVLGIGVSMGVKEFVEQAEERELVEASKIEKAVHELMGGGEATKSRRGRVRVLQEKARRAAEEGGSSYVGMENLIKELTYNRVAREGGNLM